MFYEVGFVILLLGFLIGHFLYRNVWVPKVVNKSAEYFKVARIEKYFLTGGEMFFALVNFIWIVMLYDYLYKALSIGSDSDVGGAFLTVLIIIIWNLIKWLIYRKKHECIRVKRNFDVKTQIEMIEQERFEQIAKNIWHSKNWIRIGEKFFPKTTILGVCISTARGHNSIASIDIYTIDGKEHHCNDFWYYDPMFYENVNKLIDTLPIRSLYEKREGDARIGLRWVKCTEMFDFYMKTHTTQELIENPELVIAISKEFKDK